MKFVTLLASTILCLFPLKLHGNFLKDYLNDRYPLKLVTTLPGATSNTIVIISSRNIKVSDHLQIKRGLDAHFRLSMFVATLIKDTAYLMPISNLEESAKYLSEEKDFLVMVDGHGKTFGQSMERGFELTGRFNINMVVFDWPTDYLAIRKTVYNASEVTVSFIKAMRALDKMHAAYYQENAVSVIFHSMGNRIIKEISSTRMLDKMPHALFSNLIINAAAVKQHNHAKWVEKLDIQKRIFITMNERDFNLRGAAVMRLAEQLGLSNKNKTARNAYYVNFSNISTVEHNLFLGKSNLEETNPEIYTFYDLAFHGKEVAFTEKTGFQILSPSDKSFLFSVK